MCFHLATVKKWLQVFTLVLSFLIACGEALAQARVDSLRRNSVASFDSVLDKSSANVRDTLQAFRKSVLDIVHAKLGRDTILYRKDSLRNMLSRMNNKDSIVKKLLSQFGYDPRRMNADTLIRKIKAMPEEQFKKSFGRLKENFPQLKETSVRKRLTALLPYNLEEPEHLGTIGGGYINYQFMYRSMSDTPFVEANLSQHMITAGMDFAVADIPFRLTYYGRQSNSAFLRNYHDFRIEFNGPEFRRIRQQQLRKQFTRLFNSVLDDGILDSITLHKNRLSQVRGFLSNQQWISKYLECKKLLTYRDRLPTDLQDKKEVVTAAEQFVGLYELKRDTLAQLQQLTDSLENKYRAGHRKIQQLQKVVNGNLYTQQGLDIIRDSLDKADVLDRRTAKLLKVAYAVRRFELGRTVPRLTQLTVNNLNVSGVNFEYNANNLYLAATAGKIDFRSRDFLYGKPSPIKQYVYAGSIGYGTKEGRHLILTGYSGRKQIISNAGLSASPLSGMSLEAQWRFGQNVLLSAEAAQSTSPAYTSSQGIKTQGFNWSDKTNKAYAVKGYGYFPVTQTRFEAYYQKAGINFQNFTNYRINANTSTWHVRLEQMLWKRQLRIMAAARKNDYSNPFVLQQYNTNTIFTSFSATFRKRKWPSLSIGYMPSSQYTMVGNQVAENRYQSLNMTVAHAYRIGLMTANATLMYNRFYNGGTDTGFVYYNAEHFYTMHQFAFKMFSANMGYARTANNQYALDIMEGGLSITYFRKIIVGMGVKINKYNLEESETGGYFNLRTRDARLGDFSFWYERGYLPGSKTMLIKNEWFTLGYTRYINKKLKL